MRGIKWVQTQRHPSKCRPTQSISTPREANHHPTTMKIKRLKAFRVLIKWTGWWRALQLSDITIIYMQRRRRFHINCITRCSTQLRATKQNCTKNAKCCHFFWFFLSRASPFQHPTYIHFDFNLVDGDCCSSQWNSNRLPSASSRTLQSPAKLRTAHYNSTLFGSDQATVASWKSQWKSRARACFWLCNINMRRF